MALKEALQLRDRILEGLPSGEFKLRLLSGLPVRGGDTDTGNLRETGLVSQEGVINIPVIMAVQKGLEAKTERLSVKFENYPGDMGETMKFSLWIDPIEAGAGYTDVGEFLILPVPKADSVDRYIAGVKRNDKFKVLVKDGNIVGGLGVKMEHKRSAMAAGREANTVVGLEMPEGIANFFDPKAGWLLPLARQVDLSPESLSFDERQRFTLAEKQEYLQAIQSVLKPIGSQVSEGLKRYGLEFEARRTEKFGLGLAIVTGSRYKKWLESDEWQGKVVEGNSWPVLLVLGEGVSREAVGSLKIDEYEGSGGEQIPRGLNVERINDRGIKNTLLSARVEIRSNEEWYLRRNDKNGFYAVSVGPNLVGIEQEVNVLALLYQRKDERLSITPFSVITTNQLLGQLQTVGGFTSLKEVGAEIAAGTKPEIIEKDSEADLSKTRQFEGDSLFAAVRGGLGTDPEERVKAGVVGGKLRVAWLNKAKKLAVSGGAWKAGYFDRGSAWYSGSWGLLRSQGEGKVVTTHIAVEIDQVSGSALAERKLKQADSGENGIKIQIYLLQDGTIKVGEVDKPVKEVKDPQELQFWQSVLVGMKV